MIDCNKTDVFFKELQRMCEETKCLNCALSFSNNGIHERCSYYICQFPKKALKVVQEWSDKHPRKTYIEDMKEKFPKLNEYALKEGICLESLYGDVINNNCDNDCRECWNKPMEE